MNLTASRSTEIPSAVATRPALVGGSLPIRRLLSKIDLVAQTPASVLIRGETGTGKEVVAQRIHSQSARASGPFIVIDCGALSPSLAESELFGHERGAFTGANTARAGLFEQANGGTVFLDELGELPSDLQPKLLRVLEQRMVRRVGGSRQIPIDVRVISATHRELRVEVERGRFRQDLYYRVVGITLEVPALRERLDDLPLLVEHFLRKGESPMRFEDLEPSVMRQLRSHSWPGNVRELRNAVQRLMIAPHSPFCDGPRTQQEPEHHSQESDDERALSCVTEMPQLHAARRASTSAFERAYLGGVLAATDHNVTRAARVAGVSRQMIQRMITKHGIRRTETLSAMSVKKVVA